ncbi:MAG: hypothetical protein M1814_004580 [Vezdaea aestivalis]|nr:MAG: hypothetical protein M1814_004580 [Vezdaea aestivalis]
MAPPMDQIRPPPPKFTEEDLPDLLGKVIIVTGASSGIGFELVQMLFTRRAKIYVCGRNPSAVKDAVVKIQRKHGQDLDSCGILQPLFFDLAEPETIVRAAMHFCTRETRLDVLIHNAGIMTPGPDKTTAKGYDLEMATNCLGPFLLTRCLEGRLKETATLVQSPGSVRVIWVAGMLAGVTLHEGFAWDEEAQCPSVLPSPIANYMQSKVGNTFLAHGFPEHLGPEILSLSVHPGFMKTKLQRSSPIALRAILKAFFKSARFGAYTEMFAAFSPEIKVVHNGGYITPWGRLGEIPERTVQHMSLSADSLSERFFNWCEEETKADVETFKASQAEQTVDD